MESREGGDISYRDMTEEMELGESEISKFYAGTTIFLTGGTGFLGKLLIEKILRCCPDIKKLYVLVRPKKGKEITKRLEEQFEDPLYDKVRKLQPDYMSKIEILPGDISNPDLGLSEKDQNTLINEVEVIFHVAATVRFDEKLKTATYINVRSIRDLLVLARRAPKLRTMVHVSTAYSNCTRKHIEEKFYPAPIDGDKLIQLMESLDDKVMDDIKDAFLGDYPNTYAYTKAVAENIVHKHSKGLPVAMIRPAIVIATNKEPVCGWIDNIYGPTGVRISVPIHYSSLADAEILRVFIRQFAKKNVVVGAAVGLLRSLHCDKNILADLVPGDNVINAIIALGWDVAKTRDNPNKELVNAAKDTHDDKVITEETEDEGEVSDVPVYNYVSSEEKPLTWEMFMHWIEKYGMQIPSTLMMWPYCFRLTKSKAAHVFLMIFAHLLPAYIIDGAAYCIGKKPMLVKAYEKVHKFTNVISYFSTQQWKFENQNTRRLFQKMCPADKETFDFDMSSLVWADYFDTYIKGVRVYLLKDPLDTIPAGEKKLKKLYIAHYIVVTVLSLLLLRFLWFILSSLMLVF